MASQSDTIESLVLAVAMNTQQVNKALKALERDTAQTANKITKNFDNVVPFERTQQSFSRSSKQMANDAKVLSFQFNDLFTQISSGTSVTQALNQQMGQIGQSFSGLTSIRAGASLVGQALLGMVPTLALTGAFAAVTYAATNYFNTTKKGTAEARKELEGQVEEIKRIAQQWQTDATPAAKRYFDNLIASAQQALNAITQQEALDNLFEKPKEGAKDLTVEVANVASMLQQAGENDAADEISQAWKDVKAKIDANQPALNEIKRLHDAVNKSVSTGVSGIKELSDNIKNNLLPQMKETAKVAADIRFEPQAGNIPQIPPFQEPGAFEDSRNIIERRIEIERLNTAAAKLIKTEEGFRQKAYPDKNARTGKFDAWRVGFGSDTYVDQMGKVQQVTKDTVITLDQANSDLARRVGEFQATIRRQIGNDTWRSLEENQQAALTSIAYNYGSLPDSIVAAIQQGDRGKVAQAIAGLSANPDRRKREAAMYGGAAAAEGLREQKRTLDDLMLSEKQQLELEQKKAEINANTALSESERLYQIDKLTIAMKLQNEAKAAGIELDAKGLAAIDATASALARQAQQQRDVATAAKERTRATAEAAQSAEQLVSAGLTTFVSELRAGASAADALRSALNRVLDVIIQIAINQISKGFGSLFSTAHSGGVVGSLGASRRVNPLVFAGAPRMHNGGLVPGEVPIIAQKGEIVLPRGALKRGNNGAGSLVSTSLGDVNIDMSQSGVVAADNATAKQFGVNVQKLIQAEMVRESRPGGLLRRV